MILEAELKYLIIRIPTALIIIIQYYYCYPVIVLYCVMLLFEFYLLENFLCVNGLNLLSYLITYWFVV